MKPALLLLMATLLATIPHSGQSSTPSLVDFDLRARAGARLNVVFFGASLTWGANASDPQLTSYRADVARKFEAAYPQAHFHFWDAAIGGTGSQLGVFRLDRDVLRHLPDLVFVDFSANDDITSADPETLASYEAILRRLIVGARVPVVQMLFPFMWNVSDGNLATMKRRTAHLALSAAYGTALGDAIALACRRVRGGKISLQQLWPYDGVHPGDAGYALFADAAWEAYRGGIKRGRVCAAPSRMVYADTYMHSARVRLSTLGALPPGWRIGQPNLTSAYYDMLMSRWLDDEVIASNAPDSAGPKSDSRTMPPCAPLKLHFNGCMVLLFGESTPKSGKFKVYIDGKLVEPPGGSGLAPQTEFDAGQLGVPAHGNAHLTLMLARGLQPTEHELVILPTFTVDTEQEIRLESVCVAGGQATVYK